MLFDPTSRAGSGMQVANNQTPAPSAKLTQSTINSTGTIIITAMPTPQDTSWKRKLVGRRSTSKVWDYFKYEKSSETSLCTIDNCRSRLKGKNTTNLKNHLQGNHKTEYGLVVDSDANIKNSPLPTSSNSKNQRNLDSTGNLLDYKYEKDHPKQRRFSHQLSLLFGANSIPNNLIINEDLTRCFEIADPKLNCPGRKALESSIDQLMDRIKNNICQRLERASKICVSSDIWTKRGMTSSYLGVLATYYDSNEERKVNAVLAVRKFGNVRHTSTNIVAEMESIFSEYKLPDRKIWKVMTDSGSNMVCAFREQCIDGPNVGDESIDEDEDHNSNANFKYSRLSCFIHTLLLALKKVDTKKSFENLTSKTKTLVSKFSSSQVLTGELLRLTGLTLVSFSNTRWNTTFLVLQRLMLVKESIQSILMTNAKQKYDLSPVEWKLADKLKNFLSPFNKYTDMSSTEGTRPLSEVVMILKQLQKHLQAFCTERGFIGLAKVIQEDMQHRFNHYFHEEGDQPFEGVYLASTLLDPRYRIVLSAAEAELAKKHLLTSYLDESNEKGNCASN